MHEYNSQLEHLHLKEYGRNIQKIAQYIQGLEEKEKQSRMAQTLVELMKQINPNSKDNLDYDHMIWDHLYLVSDLKLDLIDSPYPKPETKIQPAPKKVDYSNGSIRFLHYGKNVELLIQKAIKMEDAEERETATIHIARLMKKFYCTWNKENVENEVILNHIQLMSGKKLSLDPEKVNDENLLSLPKLLNTPNNSSYSTPKNNGRKGYSQQQNRRRKK